MNAAPHVSVVVPTYQRAHFVGDVIAMLLAQTLTDIEIIVADDGSTDDTAQVVGRFADPRLRYLPRGHLGMPAILNEGFRAARGRYVMTCHDHDIYEPSVVEELAGALDRFPTAAYAHCGLYLVDSAGTRILQRHVHDFAPLTPGPAFLERHLLDGLDSAVCASTMVRASALNGDVFDPAYGFVADVEMWLRLAARGDVAYVARPLIRGRQRDESSELFAVGPRLALNVVRAKRTYLHLARPDRRQQIERRWRRQATATVLRELLYAAADRRADTLAELDALTAATGSAPARLALGVFRRLPRPVSAGALRSLRYTARMWRGAVAAR